jgi:ABC-2 type transport system ATP-binding protein
MSRDGDRTLLRVPKTETPRVTARLLADLPVTDLTVEEPPIEDVIRHVFERAPRDVGAPREASAPEVPA